MHDAALRRVQGVPASRHALSRAGPGRDAAGSDRGIGGEDTQLGASAAAATRGWPHAGGRDGAGPADLLLAQDFVATRRRAGRVSGAARLWQSLPTDALLFARALDRAFDDITAGVARLDRAGHVVALEMERFTRGDRLSRSHDALERPGLCDQAVPAPRYDPSRDGIAAREVGHQALPIGRYDQLGGHGGVLAVSGLYCAFYGPRSSDIRELDGRCSVMLHRLRLGRSLLRQSLRGVPSQADSGEE